MKKFVGLLALGSLFMATSCQEDQRTSETVLEVDTVGADYEVERTVKEREVEVDTTTETQTIEGQQYEDQTIEEDEAYNEEARNNEETRNNEEGLIQEEGI